MPSAIQGMLFKMTHFATSKTWPKLGARLSACAVRVVILGLCVCVCVCVHGRLPPRGEPWKHRTNVELWLSADRPILQFVCRSQERGIG